MAKGTDWNKHGVIAGYGAWVWAAAGIVVALWLGFRQAPTSTSGVTGPGQAPSASPILPLWAVLAAALIYSAGIIIAALCHYKARQAIATPADVPALPTESHESDLFGVTIDQYRAENIRLVDETNSLRNKLAECQRELALRLEEQQKAEAITEHFWRLKDGAREIRRCWPDADFNKRPLFRASWVPAAGVIALWLDKAVAWHKVFCGTKPASDRDERYLNSLDFDEVMELLDNSERAKHGKTGRDVSVSPYQAPAVVISRWGQEPSQSYEWGFFLKNHGEPANRISILPVRLGERKIQPTKPFLGTLLNDQGEIFIPALITPVQTEKGTQISGSNLSAIISSFAVTHNGSRLPVLVKLVYEDGKGNWYGSRHAMTPPDSGQESPKITHLNCEWLTSPP